MKIVILCTKYSTTEHSPYLTDELANALASKGHQVTVLLADWAAEYRGRDTQRTSGNDPRLVISQPVIVKWLPVQLQKAVKWGVSPLLMARKARSIFDDVKPDIVIAFSPLVAMYMPVWVLTNSSVARRFLVQWDFFPDSHVQNDLLHGRKKIKILRAIESYLMRRFNVIGCMSPKNIEYLQNHCAIAPNTQTVHLPLWTSCPPYKLEPRTEVRQRYGIPLDAHVFVFGGQLISGRGIDDMLAVAKRLDPSTDRVLFLFIGRGPMAVNIKAVAQAGNPFVKLMDGVSRSEYLTLLSACDVGIVCTVRNVTVPTFPSKTVDYLLAGLPILASVEAATDYGDFIELNNVGVKVLAGDINGILEAVRKLSNLSSDANEIAIRCKTCLDSKFSVLNAMRIICGSRS